MSEFLQKIRDNGRWIANVNEEERLEMYLEAVKRSTCAFRYDSVEKQTEQIYLETVKKLG